MTTITCKIPDELNAQLEAEAARKLLPKSALVREALERSLKRSGETPRKTAFDIVKNLCGLIKGGPADMSTNPKYMKDFGEVPAIMPKRQKINTEAQRGLRFTESRNS